MKTISLNGEWNIKSHCGTYELRGCVPGSFFYTLEQSGYWQDKDVFWRDNNDQCREIAERDYTYSRTFSIDEDFINSSKEIMLIADGLDTLTEIRVNGSVVAKTYNMHRRYQFDIKDLLKCGDNSIEIDFYNTLSYIRKKQEERFIWSITDTTIQGFNRIRKCSSSFGWDWGPIIPDLGIWRDIYITSIAPAKLTDPEIRQIHRDGEVEVTVKDDCYGYNLDNLIMDILLTAPDSTVQNIKVKPGEIGSIIVKNPEFWWPNGYGKQNLYSVDIKLKSGDKILDEYNQNIGLRTMELNRDKDENGENFGFKVNGITIFAMGGNIIPQDVYITRNCEPATKKLLESCAQANFNCIRVWGGGIYPDKYFYDTCDRLGLIIWHDLMFACALYEAGNKEFRKEITLEVKDNLKRLRNHPSIGVVCGNNEMEWAFVDWENMQWGGEEKAEYTLQYDYLLPEIAAEVSPDIPYWKASPSSGGFFDNPNDADRGDVHYWDIWHGGKPFTDFRKNKFRFLSEYGFQSFPSYKTVCSYTTQKDRNPFSPIMENHQRNGDYSGNQKIMKYAAEYYMLGKDMNSHCYLSQVNQAEAGRYAVEHMRQNRGVCLGSTYWQVNDIWPVASWSSLDYFGRWKALHYAMKRAYDPILLSCREEGTKADIYVTTEGMEGFSGSVEWALKDLTGKTIKRGKSKVEVESREAKLIESCNFESELSGKALYEMTLSLTLKDKRGVIVRRNNTVFTRYKKIDFIDPELTFELMESNDLWNIKISSKAFAKFVELEFTHKDLIFSDNYFDMDGGEERVITVKKADLVLEDFKNLKVRSLFDTY